MSITTIFRDACLFAYSLSMLLSKTEDHGGHSLVQDQLNNTKGEPQSPRVAPEVQQFMAYSKQNVHSIKGRTDTPYVRNGAVRTFPI